MKLRLLSTLLVFLLLASISITTVSAIPVANAHPAVAPAAGIAFDAINEILNPVEKIQMILKEQQIKNLTEKRAKAIEQLSILKNSLTNIKRKCIENQQKIRKEYAEITDERKTCKRFDGDPVKFRKVMNIRKQIEKDNNEYRIILNAINGTELRIEKLNEQIKNGENDYIELQENAMSGHEIMNYIKELIEENKQLKNIIREIVKENETMLKMLDK